MILNDLEWTPKRCSHESCDFSMPPRDFLVGSSTMFFVCSCFLVKWVWKQSSHCTFRPIKTGFPINALSLAFDWLIFKEHQFYWLTVLSGLYQFENLSKSDKVVTRNELYPGFLLLNFRRNDSILNCWVYFRSLFITVDVILIVVCIEPLSNIRTQHCYKTYWKD